MITGSTAKKASHKVSEHEKTVAIYEAQVNSIKNEYQNLWKRHTYIS